jgi:hypothetical protein
MTVNDGTSVAMRGSKPDTSDVAPMTSRSFCACTAPNRVRTHAASSVPIAAPGPRSG